MARYTNTSQVPLSIAVYLATDSYDYNSETISATSLIKPLRQLILSARVPTDLGLADLTQMMSSRMGSSIHDGIERSWTHNYQVAMSDLGIPNKVIGRVLINPKPEDLYEGCIPVYLEQRSSKQVGKWLVSGKFDFVGDGRLEDFKSTGTYTAMNHTGDEKYILQGSIYKWLNPLIITRDEMAIQFIFTDWSSMQARTNPKYPQYRFLERVFPLMTVNETERYVTERLAQIELLWDADEADLPLCTDDELWRSEPIYKFYKGDPALAKRSSKNFDNQTEALLHRATLGVGTIVEKPGRVTACKFCAAFPVCSQKDTLIAIGDLVL